MSEQHELRQELEDRHTDQALQELLGGRCPPDLTTRILSAARPARRWRSRRRQVALAATVLATVGIAASYVIYHRHQRASASQIATNSTAAPTKHDVAQLPDKNEPTTNADGGNANDAATSQSGSQTNGIRPKLAALVDEFNKLMHERRFAEAQVVAKRAAEIAPESPGSPETLVVQQLKLQLRMVSRTEDYRKIRDVKQEGYVAGLNGISTVDDQRPYQFGDLREWRRLTQSRKVYPVADLTTKLPTADEPSILYPDPEVWRMLADRRKKYKAVDLSEQSAMEAKILAALDERTDLDFSEQPLTDVVEYFKQRHDIEIQIDSKALSDEGVGTDAPVTRHSNGITLRSALKLLLGDLELTYVIRKDGMMITSKAGAERLLEARAYELMDNSATKRLRTPVWLKYKNVPLKQVVEDLGKLAQLPIQIDFSSAAKEKVTADTPITIELTSEISTKSALDLVLQPLHLSYVVENGGLRIRSTIDCVVDANHDRYSRIIENPFLSVGEHPLSTFGVDVDTASYAKVRRYILQEGELPPPDAVRIEELVNYFDYDYAPPDNDVPFATHVEVAACPWQAENKLLRIGLKGREVPEEERPAANLVFLLDVSGSMEPDDRLPRAVRAMRLLVERLRENDRVAIVVYAGESGLALPSTAGFQKERIASALDSLHAGGSTNGASGIRLAYDTAQEHFIKGGTNRVILCTDGDFNVGATSAGELELLIEERAKGGVFLTVLGFGIGNHNDELMEKLADKGNGNYGYIDSEAEARKLLVEQAGGTLVTIAKDVKAQLEFNPRLVAAYRLIGYEDRVLPPEDFNNDKKDAGDIGAGHTVTALYELIPAGQPVNFPEADELKYQRPAVLTEAAASDELLTLKLKYKQPDGQESEKPLIVSVRDSKLSFDRATADFQYAAAVAGFGMLLRDSQFRGNLTYGAVREIAEQTIGRDPQGRRKEFVQLVRQASALDARRMNQKSK
jgi:Ca-activated chloride channel homolog